MRIYVVLLQTAIGSMQLVLPDVGVSCVLSWSLPTISIIIDEVDSVTVCAEI